MYWSCSSCALGIARTFTDKSLIARQRVSLAPDAPCLRSRALLDPLLITAFGVSVLTGGGGSSVPVTSSDESSEAALADDAAEEPAPAAMP